MNGKCIEKTFGELHQGTLFYLWSEFVFAARTPNWVLCEKTSETIAQEIDGCRFQLQPQQEVFIFVDNNEITS